LSSQKPAGFSRGELLQPSTLQQRKNKKKKKRRKGTEGNGL
jgi:hypothetical protein